MSEITLKNVSKIYSGGNYAVKDFSLDIYNKEFVIFVGPSGCGKSTTLRMIAGLEEISDGELWIDGELCNYYEPKDRGMSMVFQNYALYPNMTVYGNLAYALKIRKIPKDEIDRKVHKVARVLEIEHLLDRRPAALSGGQKQRVAIGSAIIRKPKAFLMDEPLSNLDAKLRTQMRIELAKLHRELDTTIIYVTHDQTEAMTLGTKIVVMKDGVIQQAASPAEVYEHPVNLFVAGFIGSPGMNFTEADAVEEDGKVVLCLNGKNSGEKISVTGRKAETIRRKALGKTVIVGIRPEDLYEHALNREAGDTAEGFERTVAAREMLGAEVILYYSSGQDGKTHCVRLAPQNSTKAGQKIRLYPDPEKIHVFDRETGKSLFYGKEEEL